MANSTHKKFGDEDGSDSAEYVTAPTSSSSNTNRPTFLSDSESDDDEAPEEEGMDSAKKLLDDELQVRQKAAKLEQDLLKERRRKQDAIFKKQQIEKKQALEEKAREELKEEQIEEDDVDEELEALPEEFLNKIEEQKQLAENDIPSQTSQHINFNDLDESQYLSQEINTQLKKKKKKTLSKLRATTAKRGPVTVSVLSSVDNFTKMAPKKEHLIMSKKEKWLKRSSIKRK
ncbi:hypothetical protein TBLA_0A09190 [Henningerozyma blattae CBS 6284]|uniref:Uncharacterized protein n=1 Tax=Henningerozyma blattae (strain ATCC 34711 / CBS 6284 / DSM 70876 / NBRC 10599 / NRRL Y-10934 / UCD 77-7) TaxID=1071380 RepID=I2GX55_HENB6|nr:hypothetical protein TBLA_0A09190 [Tetrapisispora blattae CBS 6284]CCH58707.1 hypothetical protein TBLA_0A09190 [Tetrapisispora blattae CBS 6284]